MKEKLRELLGRKKVSGGEVITRILATEGVEHVFGIVDGTYFGMYSTFEEHGIEQISPRHETSAVHMAGAYARLTGELGIAMASNGPGVANALPGVAVENAEGNRVLLITSCRRQGIQYPDRGGTFQYFPQSQVIGEMAKWSEVVPSIDRVAELTRAALRESWSGRPGVVHLDVPENIMNGEFDLQESWLRRAGVSRPTEPIPPHPRQVDRVAELVAEADRVLLHAGSGVIHSQAFDELQRLASRTDAAVTTSWSARPCIDERQLHAVAMPYVDVVNRARNDADLALVLGSRLGETDWWGKPPYWAPPDEQRLVQVDIDPSAIGNNRPADVGIQADVQTFLSDLNQALADRPTGAGAERRQWLEELEEEQKKRRAELDAKIDGDSTPIHPAHVPSVCQEVFEEDSILVIDGGNTAIWANFYHEVRTPNTVVTTPKMGMLGAGCAQPVGAQIARPDKQVYCIIGDGAMGFHLQEVETAVRNELPIVWLVLCDRQWGMVKMTQQFALSPVKTMIQGSLSAEETIETELDEIEFDRVAESMGAYGARVADPSRLEETIRRARRRDKPAVIHVDVDRVEHMWAPNLQDFKEMHQEPSG